MADPICPFFGKCGGCSFQNIDYSVQLENKKKTLISKSGFPEIQVFSGKDYGYRQRMDMVFHPGGLGFRKKGSWHKVVDVDRCVISNDRLNTLLSEIREFFAGVDTFDLINSFGTFRYAVIRTPPANSSVSIVINKDSNNINAALEKIRDFAQKTTADNMIATFVPHNRDVSISGEYEVLKGCDTLKETFLGKTFEYSVQGFYQNNHDMAEKMHAYCREILLGYETQNSRLVDLYGGVGTFGIINADLFREVIIIENFLQSTASAKKNIEINNISNAEAMLLDAKHLKNIELSGPLFFILDPPRSGAHPKVFKQLNRLKPEMILYICCNPRLLDESHERLEGYSVRNTALFDFFPQTPHMEAVLELVRSDRI